ncbi:MAG: type I methionyl aminopeptidase [Spirochaetae bacterium HGW-Spirochaetae-1]|jgi:methionyl aminopeptidase|nr:MAG: type I methionyl aminopeptidase [Spirochaetae bacterium HGW-Spirochaetae-1]
MRKLARNDLCWCGSGKKYKKCHMLSDLESGTGPGKFIKPPPGVILKNSEQIEGIRKSCELTKQTLDMVEERIAEGITTNEINGWVHEFITSRGGIPAPLNYNGFPKSVCTSINEVICHGIPEDRSLKNGDIINIDVTCILDGYYGDASRMHLIGDPPEEARKIVRVARECLDVGIEQVRPFVDIGEIGFAIEKHAKANGCSVVRDYGGHGIGLRFHENPHVHHYGSRKRGITMVPNMVFTIEPMINAGRYETRLLGDNWTAVTIDGSLSAQWEHTVLVTDTGVEVLTA